MGGQAGTEAAAEGPTVDSWSDKDQRIVVSQPAAGFLYDLVLRAKIDGDPDDVYTVLVDPKSHEIFKGIRATLSRTTLEDDGKGRRKLLVGHRALTKFLWVSVTFDTELFIWEDDVARTIKFTNARSDGFMSKFDGTWHVQPFTQQTLDSIYKGPGAAQQQAQQHKGQNWLGSILHHGSHGSSSADSPPSALVTLNQALSPRVRPPGPVAHLVRGLCGRVLNNMMGDLRAEVARRQQLEAAAETAHTTGAQPSFGALSSSKGRQVANRPPLPVASLTLSSSRSSGSMAGRLHSSLCGNEADSEADNGGGVNVMECAGQVLIDLLATAVPLHITVKM